MFKVKMTVWAPLFLVVPTLVFVAEALGETPEHTAVGEYQLNDFAILPKLESVGLSKQGSYFSAFLNGLDKPYLVIREISEPDAEPFLVGADHWTLRWYEWLSDTQLILSVNWLRGRYETPPTRLMMIDVPKRRVTQLFRNHRSLNFYGFQDDFIGTVPDQPDRILIGANTSRGNQVYLAKLNKSPLPSVPYQTAMKNIYQWYADDFGVVRAGSGYDRTHSERVIKLLGSDGNWHNYHDFVDDFEVMAMPSNQPDTMYVQIPGPGVFREVRALKVSTRELGEIIAAHPESDVAKIVLNAQGTAIDYVVFENEQVSIEYRDPLLKDLMRLIDAEFNTTKNHISAITDNRSRAIITTVSANLPPQHYLFDGPSMRLHYLDTTYPTLVQKAPGQVHEVTFTARDGLRIPGYITIPKSVSLSEASLLPFIVYPHGGPAARDFKRFDWIAQMFTAAGYGVLQINFRGSTGYGVAFEEAGHRQWGRAMQNDITDGTQWLVEQGIADPKRICLFGGSYGGYAALMGIAKEPKLYACAASLNGVTDLEDLISSENEYIGGKYYTRLIGRLWKDRRMLRENSPLRIADQITKPVLLIHGETDRVVPVRHSRRMQRSLADQIHTYLELPGGDHYLSNQNNRLKFAETLLKFLDDHLEGRNSSVE